MAQELRRNLRALETTTSATLAIMATGSGYWTYLGVKGLLDDNGLTSLGGAVIYSVAVSVAIYAFWTYLMRFLPAMTGGGSRLALFLAMGLGCIGIVAMSSWLNAAALAGSAAIEQHLAEATEEYQSRLEAANENALAAQTLLPDLELAAARFADLAASEETSGSLTGSAGHGTIVALLTQTSRQLADLAERIRDSRDQVEDLYERGSQHLVAMRRLTGNVGQRPIDERAVAFADEAVALVGVITALQQSSVAPAVKRAADDLAETFVRPAPSGGASDLGQRQEAVIESVADSVEQTSVALSRAAGEILDRPAVLPFRFTPVSSAEAVLLYADDFVPSWAGAIAIDMMPAVLVLVLMVVHGVIRQRESGSDLDGRTLTVAELTGALAALERIQGSHALRPAAAATEAASDDASAAGRDGAAEPSASVTAIHRPRQPGGPAA
ncbi:MAG: hypothetical protein R3F55_19125 [Alphaproteobacteria bacterium]